MISEIMWRNGLVAEREERERERSVVSGFLKNYLGNYDIFKKIIMVYKL